MSGFDGQDFATCYRQVIEASAQHGMPVAIVPLEHTPLEGGKPGFITGVAEVNHLSNPNHRAVVACISLKLQARNAGCEVEL